MRRDRSTVQRDELPCNVLMELHRLRCQMQLATFKEELRRDAATMRRELDEGFWKMERREGGRP